MKRKKWHKKRERARFHGVANPGLAAGMRGLRSSNAAVPHVPKPRRGVRGVRDAAAIRDSADQ